jgi:predicted acyl esterase
MRDMVATPVDADPDKSQLMAAHAEHANGVDNLGYLPFRDSKDEHTHGPWWQDSSPHTHIDAINQSGIAVYLAANWDEATTKQGAFYTFNNLTTPKKLIVGPGTHCAWTSVMKTTGFDITIEELRFFDYWLKGIQNGVMDEPPVTYYEYNAPEGQEWRTSDQWPLADAKPRQFYFGARLLGVVPASNAKGSDSKLVEYDVTPDNMLDKGLVYQSPALSVDYHIIGHPVADLWVSSTATDGDFIVTLQDLSPDGTAVSYNTQGRLRASHRKLADAPYNALGLPWHPSNESDVQPLTPNEPAELKIELLPIAMNVKAGHSLRLIVTFAAEPATPKLDPAPTVSIYREAMHGSLITLPVWLPPTQ